MVHFDREIAVVKHVVLESASGEVPAVRTRQCLQASTKNSGQTGWGRETARESQAPTTSAYIIAIRF